MKVIKNINNNVSVCITSSGAEVIAFGKGIGFKKPPYEIELSQIERTFYDVDDMYIRMINDIPEQVLEISAQIVDYAKSILDYPVGANMVFTLADHINFAIQRAKNNLQIQLPILYDVEHLFEKEMQIGKNARELIHKKAKVYLPKEEAACIALHFINMDGIKGSYKNKNQDEEIIEEITNIIEQFFGISIDREDFNYSRFAMHMRYLIRRGENNELIGNENPDLFESLSQSLPKIRDCVIQISDYLEKTVGCQLTDEEHMYLILHTNRLCGREDHMQ